MHRRLLLALIVLLTPAVVFAGSIHSGQIGLGMHLAVYEPSDVDTSTGFFGFQSRIRLGDSYAIEGAIDFYSEENKGVDYLLYPVQASLLIYIISSRILEVHGTAGMGWYYWQMEDKASSKKDSGNDVGYHAGAGVELPLMKHLSLHADVRWIFFKPNVEDVFQDVNNWDGLWTNIGFTLYF